MTQFYNIDDDDNNDVVCLEYDTHDHKPLHKKPSQKWQFYDFDANWEKFYQLWCNDDVQHIQKNNMDEWFEMLVEQDTKNGRGQRFWNVGDSLWQHGLGEYFDDMIEEKSFCFLEDNNRIYKKRMREILGVTKYLHHYDSEDISNDILNIHKDALTYMFGPKHGTLESLIMTWGKSYVTEALGKCGSTMFPDEEIVFHGSIILIPGKQIVFDMYDFYWTKVRMQPQSFPSRTTNKEFEELLKSDEYYDNICDDNNYDSNASNTYDGSDASDASDASDDNDYDSDDNDDVPDDASTDDSTE